MSSFLARLSTSKRRDAYKINTWPLKSLLHNPFHSWWVCRFVVVDWYTFYETKSISSLVVVNYKTKYNLWRLANYQKIILTNKKQIAHSTQHNSYSLYFTNQSTDTDSWRAQHSGAALPGFSVHLATLHFSLALMIAYESFPFKKKILTTT